MSKQRIFDLTRTWPVRILLPILLTMLCAATVSNSNAQSTKNENSLSAKHEAGSSKGGQEEIKVHGHWIIDVRNADGTLVTHRDFENALTNEGALTLARLLGRQETNGPWLVRLENRQGENPCEGPTASGVAPVPCGIVESGFPVAETSYLRKNLELTLTPSGAIVLSGTTTAARASTIDFVYTLISTCQPSGSPKSCATDSGSVLRYFTQKALAIPVNGSCPDSACAVKVIAGQIIQVSVTINFS